MSCFRRQCCVLSHEEIPGFWLQAASLLPCLRESATLPWAKWFLSASVHPISWWGVSYHCPPPIFPIKYKNQNIFTFIFVMKTRTNVLLTSLHVLLTSASVLSTDVVCCVQLWVYFWCLWVIVYSCKCTAESCSVLFTAVNVLPKAVVYYLQL